MYRHLLIPLLCGLILSFSFLLPRAARALDIPGNLANQELSDVIQILGFNTSSKFLSNPYPLGGYSGFEFGLATEFVNTTDLTRLGDGQSDQKSFQYNRISVGKGLYNNLDAFVHFIPFSSSNEISEYGGILKWNFFQSQYLPISASLLGNASTINIEDKFINESLGWSILGGINLSRFALYFGAGDIKARSTFAKSVLDLADPNNYVSSQNTLTTRSSQGHSYVGIHIDIASAFLVLQIDRYKEPVYSAKLGLRF